MKEYMKPDVEVVVLMTEETINSMGGPGTEMDIVSNPFLINEM